MNIFQSKIQDSKNNWIQLKNNIFSFFPNHFLKFDNSLRDIFFLKYEYAQNLKQHQELLQSNHLEEQKKPYTLSGNDFEKIFLLSSFSMFFFFTPLYLFFTSFPAYIPELREHSSGGLVSLSFISIFITSYLALIPIKKSKINKNIAKNISEIIKSEEDLKNIEHKYQLNVRRVIKNGEYINIRDQLDYHYHTEIPELNLIVQNILEQSIPEYDNMIITTNINDNLDSFKPEKLKYIRDISDYLNNAIDDKIKSIALDKMLTMNKK